MTLASLCRAAAGRLSGGDGTRISTSRMVPALQTSAERPAVASTDHFDETDPRVRFAEPSPPHNLASLHSSLHAENETLSGHSSMTVRALNSLPIGYTQPRPRQWSIGPAQPPQGYARTARMACKARPSMAASAASTGGGLPAIGSGCRAVTAGQWLAEVAEPAPATVQCGQ